MPIYIISARKQVQHTGFIEASSSSEARRIARENPDVVDWISMEEIFDAKPLTIMNCRLDESAQ